MKQVLQHLRTGEIEVAELPCPPVRPGALLIQTRASLISAGTERMLVEFSKASLIQKARQQPEKVKQVLDKIKTDGLMPTLETVFRQLDTPLPLGYCNAGVVLEVGPGIHDVQPGDRVVSNGPHAEIVNIPRNLCATIPAEVNDEQATFTVLGSIALQGLRLAAPTLGERFMVFGTGVLGLLTVQLLRAHGCEVLAVDLNRERLQLAAAYGAQTVHIGAGGDPIIAASTWTKSQGVDGVLVTASAKTDEIMHQAAKVCRKRGRIILVGVVDLNLQRRDFYEKELSFQVSCSYGPGRYDDQYERAGQDYPLGYVRWTAQRNFEAVLGAMQAGHLRVDEIMTHRFALTDAASAYEKIEESTHALGVMLQYPTEIARTSSVRVIQKAAPAAAETVVGVIGAGHFTQNILIPALSKTTARVRYLADHNADRAYHVARKYSVEKAITDYKRMLDDPRVQAVFIVVGHHLHARLVCEALEADKHVFVEKPLAMNEGELALITDMVSTKPDRAVMVGFNRRFSPHLVKMNDLLSDRSSPLCMTMTINAGDIPPDHWVQDPARGGGRIIGEACHFIDVLSRLATSSVATVSAMMVGNGFAVREDKMAIVLSFSDGSVGTVNYFANGSKKYPKEIAEVFSDGRVLKMANFRTTRGYGFKGFRNFRTFRQDKGHDAEVAAFIDRITIGGKPLIPFEQLENITRASFAAMESAQTGRTVVL